MCRSVVEINYQAIENNARKLKDLVGECCMVAAVVKANAYGHGVKPAAEAVLRGGASRFMVATLAEALALRTDFPEVPIHILGTVGDEEIPDAVAGNVIISVHDLEIPRLLSGEALRQGKTVKLHLCVDSGMGRLGTLPETACGLAVDISKLDGIELEGVFTHFAAADDREYTRKQLDVFMDVCAQLEHAGFPGLIRHAANTVATIDCPESRLDMVRPGIGLYGMVCPESFHERILLEPALSWCTSIHHIKKYPAGACLGYDRTYVTKRNSVIAVIPVGYADGYPRHLSNRGRVLVCGRYAPVVGRISMDYTMIDVTDIPEALVRAEVMLIGRDGENSVTAEELAARTDTIPYCITTGIAHRPVRKSNLA